MSTIITPYALRQIESDKFKGKTREKAEILKKTGQHGISHFQMKKELEKMGYDREKRDKLVKMMCDLADEKTKKNIKMAKRLSKTFEISNNESDSFVGPKKQFAQQANESSRRELALQKLKKGGSASVKSQETKMPDGRTRASALSFGDNQKTGFAQKLEEKKTGFAGRSNNSNNLAGGNTPLGIGSNLGGGGRLKL